MGTTEEGADVWFIRDDCHDRGFLAAPGTPVLYDVIQQDQGRDGKLRAIGVRLPPGTLPPAMPHPMNPLKRSAPAAAPAFAPGPFAPGSFVPNSSGHMALPRFKKLASDPSPQMTFK